MTRSAESNGARGSSASGRAPDVLIVGAGIVGAACAEALACRGLRVTVLEADFPAGRASAAGMGHVLVLDDSDAELALLRRSRELWAARADEWPPDVEHLACGTLWLAADGGELQHAAARAERLAANGVRCDVVDGTELARLEPLLRRGFAGALRVPDDVVVHPPTATRHLLRRAQQYGAELRVGTPVASIGDGWLLTRDGERLEAAHIVVAAGLQSLALLAPRGAGDPSELLPPLVPKKGHLAITARAAGFVRHQLVELGYTQSAHAAGGTSVAFNVQPRATGQVLVGSSRQVGCSDSVFEPRVLAEMLARATSFLPALASLPVVRTWTGVRPATVDELPLIGPLPSAPRTWLATGHEGIGITASLGTAELVVAGLVGGAPASVIDPAPYAPARFGATRSARSGGAHV